MRTNIDYTKEDLLECQLFVASKSKRVKHNRFRNWMILTIGSFICAIIFYFGNNYFLMYYCICVGFLFLLFYPFYQRRVYKRHYNKFVVDKFKNLADLDYVVEITPESIFTNSKLGDMSIKTSQVKNITETGNYFFLELSTGDTLSLPKRSFDYNWILVKLKDIANANHISINKELNWKWK